MKYSERYGYERLLCPNECWRVEGNNKEGYTFIIKRGWKSYRFNKLSVILQAKTIMKWNV